MTFSDAEIDAVTQLSGSRLLEGAVEQRRYGGSSPLHTLACVLIIVGIVALEECARRYVPALKCIASRRMYDYERQVCLAQRRGTPSVERHHARRPGMLPTRLRG